MFSIIFWKSHFLPTFGEMFVENFLKTLIQSQHLESGEIEKAIIDNEPRASLGVSKVSPNLDRNAFDVTIVFNVNNNRSRQSLKSVLKGFDNGQRKKITLC